MPNEKVCPLCLGAGSVMWIELPGLRVARATEVDDEEQDFDDCPRCGGRGLIVPDEWEQDLE
jgi:ribosomal protein S27AE